METSGKQVNGSVNDTKVVDELNVSNPQPKKSRWWVWLIVGVASFCSIAFVFVVGVGIGVIMDDNDKPELAPNENIVEYCVPICDDEYYTEVEVIDDSRSEIVYECEPIEELEVLEDDYSYAVAEESAAAEITFTDVASDFDDFDDFDIIDEEIDEEEIFVTVEEMPTFQGGGLPEFRNWVQSRVQYPQVALENGIQGNVVIQFVVGPDGKMTNFKVLQSPDKSLSDATIAVFEEANKLEDGWKPGRQRGKAVKVSFTLPVRFKIA